VTTFDYFVAPPNHFRVESQDKGEEYKEIHILLQNGLERWVKYPNGKVQPDGHGIEMPVDYCHDYVKFFGPRVVLRLKDADQWIALLEEAELDGRPVVGVEINKDVSVYKLSLKLYFDRETNLLVRQEQTLSRASTGGIAVPTTTRYYSDYKPFDGIPVATKVKR
jgi:hypothetical protein